MSVKRDKAVRYLMGQKLADVAEKADAIVLIFGTGSIFLRPTGEPHMVEQPGHHITIDFDHPDGRQRVAGLSVKANKRAS